jgi:cytochrome c oxidase cbb3-type subunit 4
MNHPMMNPFWGHLTGAVTVVLMLIFIGIWIWAWRKRHRSSFKRMSELPMEDKPEGPVPGQGAGKNNSKGRQP